MKNSNKAKINYVGFLQTLIRSIIFSIFFLKNLSTKTFYKIKHILYPTIPPPPQNTEPDFEESYKKDIDFYKTMTPTYANSNINADLYDNSARKTLFAEENNQTEKLWKSRILFENTYRGNIIMYYDAFRMSFAYYSDEQIVPYKALYHAALRYVVKFRCRNFFIDMDTFPENPMIEILKKEDEQLKTKTQMQHHGESRPKSANPNPNPVFAKLKTYNTETAKQNKPKHPFSNKFVRIGKMCEFNILQKPPNKKIEAVNSLLFSDKPMNVVTDFFDDADDDLSIKESTTEKIPDSNNPFSENQPKMTSYQLFKMMSKTNA